MPPGLLDEMRKKGNILLNLLYKTDIINLLDTKTAAFWEQHY
jgi:hypothetical protein